MAARAGVQAEVLLSLALVMVLSTLVLTGVFVAHQEAGLRAVLGRALLAEARAPRSVTASVFPGTDWWLVGGDGRAEPRGAVSARLDPATLALADEALGRGAPLLRPGAVWSSIRFAVPMDGGQRVAVARLPREASLRLRLGPVLVVLAVAVVDASIFAVFGAFVLRRRVVGPLQRLAQAARAIAGGSHETRVSVEGTREAAEVATSFNEMTEALAGRTDELEKVVVELRSANRDLRRARAGLSQAERLAVVGRLSAGVAHEVGNPIGAILAFLDLAARDPGISADTRKHLARAGHEGERVRRILRQLLDFSRPPRPERRPVDLARVVEEAKGLVLAQRRYAEIDLAVEVAGGAGLALADSGVVTQIVLNLLINAADAVKASPSPRIRALVRPGTLERRAEDAEGETTDRRRPDAVECVVVDNGCGIPEADRSRVFDPFFTSKPPGEGTGLGLSNAVLLAEQLGGRVELQEPPPGAATAVALCLPVAGPAEPGSAARS